jgi:cation:H+ antiporter
MIINIIVLVIGLFALIKGADILVRGASAVAKKIHIPEVVIGLTIVACGTSAPETAISISSVLNGAEGIGLGNVLGSNVINTLFVLGVCALISHLCVKQNTILYEIPFVAFVSVLLMFIGWRYGVISRGASFCLLCLFVLFLLYLFKTCKDDSNDISAIEDMSFIKMILFIGFGIATLVIGAEMTVNSSVNIAHILNISERIIGLTLVAVGTSLPELVTCVVATAKKHSDIAIGTIVGSNLFNMLFVLGITGLIQPIYFDSAFLIDSAWGTSAIILLFLFIMYDSNLSRDKGILFLILYSIYTFSLIQ